MDLVTFKRFLVKTATGSLLQDICNFHDDEGTPNTLLAGLRATLVDAGEVDRRIHEADTYSQSPYQTVTDFISNYRYRFNRAYLAEDMLNEKLRQRLVRQFINGLSDPALRLYVAEGHPETMETAFERARSGANTRLWVRPSAPPHSEEPMEVDAATSNPHRATRSDAPDLKTMVSQAVATQLRGFQKQLGQIMQRLPSSPQQSRRAPAPRPERRPQRQASVDASRGGLRCFGCGRQGHIRRDCQAAAGNGQRPPNRRRRVTRMPGYLMRASFRTGGGWRHHPGSGLLEVRVPWRVWWAAASGTPPGCGVPHLGGGRSATHQTASLSCPLDQTVGYKGAHRGHVTSGHYSTVDVSLVESCDHSAQEGWYYSFMCGLPSLELCDPEGCSSSS